MNIFFLAISFIVFTSITMSQDFNKLKAYLDDKVTGKESPGVQFIIADSSGILFEYNQGTADIEQNISVNSDTQFKMYSATKLLTMISILQLVERGKIKLDNPVTEYLELDFPTSITVRKVLSHTAGFNKNPFFKELHLEEEDSTFNYTDFTNFALPKYNKIIYKPGKKNVYSNYGYLVLSAIVQKVSGVEYENYVTDNITAKINLDTNDYLGFKYTEKTAIGYQKRNTVVHWAYTMLVDTKKYYGSKTKKWQSLNNLYMKGLGFGGGFSNSRALAKLMLNLMQHKLLSEESLNNSFSQQFYSDNKTSKQTLGWWHGFVYGHKSYYHPGGGGGYSCEVRIYPDSGIVRVMMMNKTQTFGDLKMFSQIDRLWLSPGDKQ